MSYIVNEDVEHYAAEHSTPDPDFFRRLEEETRAISELPQMMVGPLEGQFLGWLVRISEARNVLEIGTFTGYSSISMALALPEGGRITSLDVNEETTAVARRYAEEAGVADRIDYRVGPAIDTLAELDGRWDLVFIDADKPNYVNYYEAVLPSSRTTASSSPTTSSGRAGWWRTTARRARRRSRPSTTTSRPTIASSA